MNGRNFAALAARVIDAKRMRRAALPVCALALLLAAVACSAAATPTQPPATPAPTALPTPSTEGGTALEAVIGPAREECVGVAPMQCLVVDGFLFYSEIDGFDYQEGYQYRILMEQYDAYPGQEIPADAGRYGYRLIEVLEKTRVR